jgi:C4-dicarboxylate-specific signal transduction histidine kinase
MMNSLTPISSLAESIRPLLDDIDTANDPARAQANARDVAEAIDAIARRSAGLVNFVERYRKMAELPPPALEPLRLADLVLRIDQLMSATLAGQRIAYSSRIDPEDLTVRADCDLLEQVLINLLHNAMDAVSGVDDPRIEVRCRLHDGHAAISVADNGRGLDGAFVERIFVPFFTTKPGGSGIGLSLARQIAHAHHGRLEAGPNTPAGAVFTLLIPLTK